MTVTQLIAMLKSLPGDAVVYYDYDDRNRDEITGLFCTRDGDDEEVVVLQSRQ